MQIRAPAILCVSRPHGETGVIARVLTREYGLIAGYVAGGRGRRLRPVLIPGNLVAADLTAKSANQLPFLKLELVESRGPWLSEPLPSAAIGWSTALVATALPERNPYPPVHDALAALLDAVCHAPSARGWAPALLKFEALVLRELGYGGDNPIEDGGDWPAMLAALRVSQRRIGERLLADRRGDVMATRTVLGERLARIG